MVRKFPRKFSRKSENCWLSEKWTIQSQIQVTRRSCLFLLRDNWNSTWRTPSVHFFPLQLVYPGLLSIRLKIPKILKKDKWYENFHGNFPGNPKIVDFPKSEPFNRKFGKFREENQMEWKFSVRNFHKFGYTSRGCPLFQKFWEVLYHSFLEIFGNSTQNFSSSGCVCKAIFKLSWWFATKAKEPVSRAHKFTYITVLIPDSCCIACSMQPTNKAFLVAEVVNTWYTTLWVNEQDSGKKDTVG